MKKHKVFEYSCRMYELEKEIDKRMRELEKANKGLRNVKNCNYSLTLEK